MLLKKGDIAGLVTLLVVIAIAASIFIFAPKTPEVAYAPVEYTGSTLTAEQVPKNDLTEVKVNAVLKHAGFITVHTAVGKAPGPIVGTSAYLPAGTYTNLSIAIPGGFDATDDYIALMFADDGNQTYDSGVDLPVMSNGAVVEQTLQFAL